MDIFQDDRSSKPLQWHRVVRPASADEVNTTHQTNAKIPGEYNPDFSSISKRTADMKTIVILSIAALALGGCANARDTRMAEGAALGGVGGAVIGGVASNSVGGAAVGGVAGAAVGAIVADATRPHHASRHCYFSERLNKRVCRYN